MESISKITKPLRQVSAVCTETVTIRCSPQTASDVFCVLYALKDYYAVCADDSIFLFNAQSDKESIAYDVLDSHITQNLRERLEHDLGTDPKSRVALICSVFEKFGYPSDTLSFSSEV